MPDKNVPENLPVEGRDLLAGVNEQPQKSSIDAVSPKANAPQAPMPKPPAPAARETQDIFADIKDQPAAPASEKQGLSEEATVVETPHQGFKKIIITASLLVIFAGILVGGGYLAYNQFLKPSPLSPSLNLNINAAVNTAAQPTSQKAEQPATAAVQQVAKDSDNDGLTDEREQGLGTDYLNPDTDGDKLFDREEVEVYKTDPLKTDTDGDGYGDGTEVQNGFNPTGAGKLIKIPAGS